MKKDNIFYRKQAKTYTTISMATALPLIAILIFALRNTQAPNYQSTINTGNNIVILFLGVVCTISFFMGQYYDSKEKSYLRYKKSNEKTEGFNNICSLIKNGKNDEALTELHEWREKYVD